MRRVKHRNEIPEFLKTVGLNKRICEVGVWLGKYHWHLMMADPDLLVGVDLFEDVPGTKGEDRYQSLLDELYNVPEVENRLIKGDSRTAWEIFDPEYFDFVYIDADHRYEYVSKDVHRWWTRVRPGGVMAGHDYAPAPPKRHWGSGVIRAVNELAAEYDHMNRLHITKEKVDPSWMILKGQG